MFTKYLLISLALVILGSLAGCGAKSPTPETATPTQSNSETSTSGTPAESGTEENYQMLPLISGKVANVTLDANADGTTQQLKMGEVLAVRLESNPSTGYSWTSTISNPAVLVQMGEPEYQEASTPLPGASGTQTFFFQAAGVGTTTLTLDYLRPFETNIAPEKTVVITVEVK